MSVITVSRGSYSGGKALAECVAKALGYRCIDRDQMIRRTAQWGLPDGELRRAIEKPPRFLDLGQHTRYAYLAVVQASLVEEAREGNLVYHGLAGHLLLKPGPYLLRVRVIAPMEYRIRTVRERLGLDRAEAIAHIEKIDNDRRKWTRLLYNVNWDDASLYDVVLNLEYIDVEQACRMVCGMVKERSQNFTVEQQNELEDFFVACRVKAHLAIHERTSSLELTVTCADGVVRCSGDVAATDQIRDIRSIATSISGVREVNLDRLKRVAMI